MENIENINNVKSIIKAFAIIEILKEAGPLSIREISQRLYMRRQQFIES